MAEPIQRVGQYNFLKRLGTGRMAEVYLGRIEGAEGFQKPVAIKKILPHLSADLQFVQSLIAEARVGGQLHHRNIVEVYDFIRYGSDYCIIMEYVDGVDLGRILRSARRYRVRIPPAAALYIASHICDGLAYAHSARGFNGEPLNIIHRDLKPSNILISIKGGVKISDFGVAKVMEEAVKRSSGDVKVSYQYQSPEQATSRLRLTAASDIFSVGVILFEMLTLEPLFPGKNVIEVLDGLRDADFSRRLALAQRQLPGSEKILSSALDPNPDARYRTAALMAEELRQRIFFLKVEDPRERLVTFFARLVRFVQKQGKRGSAVSKTGEGARPAAPEDSTIEPGAVDTDEQSGTYDGEPEGGVQRDEVALANDGSGFESDAEPPPPPGGGEFGEPNSGGGADSYSAPEPYADPDIEDAPTGESEIPSENEIAAEAYASDDEKTPVSSHAPMTGQYGGEDGSYRDEASAQPELPLGMADEGHQPSPTGVEPLAPGPELAWGGAASRTAAAPHDAVTGNTPGYDAAPVNPEETRVGSYAALEVQEHSGASVPATAQLGPQEVGAADSTRILNIGDVPASATAPPPAAPYGGQARASDQTVDSGDGTQLLPAQSDAGIASYRRRPRALLVGLGIVAMLALGGAGVAIFERMNVGSPVSDPAQTTCPVCGKVVAPDAAFCPYCGETLDGGGQPHEEAEVVCQNCGATNPQGADFCGNCGKKLENP